MDHDAKHTGTMQVTECVKVSNVPVRVLFLTIILTMTGTMDISYYY